MASPRVSLSFRASEEGPGSGGDHALVAGQPVAARMARYMGGGASKR